MRGEILGLGSEGGMLLGESDEVWELR